MDPADLGDATVLGQLATKFHRTNTKAISSFGAHGGALRKTQVQVFRRALLARFRGMDPEKRALEVARRLDSLSGATAIASMAKANTEYRLLLRAEREVLEADQGALAQWSHEHGQLKTQALLEAMPFLSIGQLDAIPSVTFPCFEWRSSTEQVAKAMACAAAEYKQGLASSVEEAWAERHKTVLHSTSVPIPAASGDSKVTKCQRLGFCVCEGPGYQL